MSDISSTIDTAGDGGTRDVSDVADDDGLEVSVLEEKISSLSSSGEFGPGRPHRNDYSSTMEPPFVGAESAPKEFAIHNLWYVRKA